MNDEVELSEKDMNAVISSACDFMTTVTEVYGQDKGVALFETICDSVDKNIYRTLIIKLLSGDGMLGRRVTITGYEQPVQPGIRYPGLIEAIRGVRDVTGLGLKDIKDKMDTVRNGTPVIIEIRNDVSRKVALTTLIQCGIELR